MNDLNTDSSELLELTMLLQRLELDNLELPGLDIEASEA